LHEVQTAENCQIEKRGKNEIITVAKILLTIKWSLLLIVIFCPSSSLCTPNDDDFVWISSNFLVRMFFRVK